MVVVVDTYIRQTGAQQHRRPKKRGCERKTPRGRGHGRENFGGTDGDCRMLCPSVRSRGSRSGAPLSSSCFALCCLLLRAMYRGSWVMWMWGGSRNVPDGDGVGWNFCRQLNYFLIQFWLGVLLGVDNYCEFFQKFRTPAWKHRNKWAEVEGLVVEAPPLRYPPGSLCSAPHPGDPELSNLTL